MNWRENSFFLFVFRFLWTLLAKSSLRFKKNTFKAKGYKTLFKLNYKLIRNKKLNSQVYQELFSHSNCSISYSCLVSLSVSFRWLTRVSFFLDQWPLSSNNRVYNNPIVSKLIMLRLIQYQKHAWSWFHSLTPLCLGLNGKRIASTGSRTFPSSDDGFSWILLKQLWLYRLPWISRPVCLPGDAL